MSDCENCPVEKDCHYPYKPCDCVHQRKFWDADRYETWRKQQAQEAAERRAGLRR